MRGPARRGHLGFAVKNSMPTVIPNSTTGARRCPQVSRASSFSPPRKSIFGTMPLRGHFAGSREVGPGMGWSSQPAPPGRTLEHVSATPTGGTAAGRRCRVGVQPASTAGAPHSIRRRLGRRPPNPRGPRVGPSRTTKRASPRPRLSHIVESGQSQDAGELVQRHRLSFPQSSGFDEQSFGTPGSVQLRGRCGDHLPQGG